MINIDDIIRVIHLSPARQNQICFSATINQTDSRVVVDFKPTTQLGLGCRAADKYTMTTKPLCWVPYYSVELSHKNTRPCCKFDSNLQGPYSQFEDFFSADSDKWRGDGSTWQDWYDRYMST